MLLVLLLACSPGPQPSHAEHHTRRSASGSCYRYQGDTTPLAGCRCHASCAACGYSVDPTLPQDCTSCANGQPVFQIYNDGTGLCSDRPPSLVAERAALMDLYVATGGARWSSQQGWGTASDHCTWSGVQCYLGGYVERLSLVRAGLSGTVPSGLADLVLMRQL